MPNATLRQLRPFVVVALFVVSAPAFATAQRTFVSSNGNDTGPCSISAPCRSFMAAIAQTNAAGEVIVQDSAGYGAVTITKSVSIIAPAGIYGGISVFSGNDGININGSSIKVVLRGLTINGQVGNNGVYFVQGIKLTIEDCEIANMSSHGIRVTAPGSTVTVKNTIMRDNVGYGFLAAGSVVATLDGVHAENNSVGVYADSGPTITVANSVLAYNFTTGVFAAAGIGTVTDVMVTHTTVTGSTYGLVVGAGSGSTVRLVSDGNAINNAAVAAFFFSGGAGTEVIYTSGNNTVGFNNGIAVGGALTPIGVH